jgi:hypothetical protein
MSVTITVDHTRRRVLVRCTGVVTYADMERHVQIEQRDGGITYSGLIDFRGCETSMSVDQVRSLAHQIHSQWSHRNCGPAAIVADHDVMYGMARLFVTLSDVTGDSIGPPIEVFRDIDDAAQWLSAYEPATGE